MLMHYQLDANKRFCWSLQQSVFKKVWRYYRQELADWCCWWRYIRNPTL